MLNDAKTKSHEYPNFEMSQELIATKVKLMIIVKLTDFLWKTSQFLNSLFFLPATISGSKLSFCWLLVQIAPYIMISMNPLSTSLKQKLNSCSITDFSLLCEIFACRVQQLHMEINLQSFTKYLRLTLVFMWNSVLQEKFNFYFSGKSCWYYSILS